MSKKSEDLFVKILSLPLAVAMASVVIIPITLYNGWALSVVWGMVAVPVLGLEPLTISHCVGIAALAGMVKTPRIKQKAHEDDTWNYAIGLLLSPLFSIAIAWCAMQFYP